MPFIRGYYVNPIAGNAIEAAREAEDAASTSSDARDGQSGETDAGDAKPVRRIEIEVAELIPAHSGRATKGFVARLHREATAKSAAESADAAAEKRVFYDPAQLADFVKNELAKNGNSR
jgi:hypothetical protein